MTHITCLLMGVFLSTGASGSELPASIVCEQRVAAYDESNPASQVGFFSRGTKLELVDETASGMVLVRMTSSSGKEHMALCKKTDLGLQGAASLSKAMKSLKMTSDTRRAMAKNRQVTYEQVNQALGIPLFADENLWDDTDDLVAGRLEWPQESKTQAQSSYRLYADAKHRVLNARPYSLALYGEETVPSDLSVIFANRGDFLSEHGVNAANTTSGWARRVPANFQKTMENEAEAIVQAMTAVLGEPREEHYGQGKRMRTKVLRWDWKGHAFLLATPLQQYVGLRVVPSERADAEGTDGMVNDMAMKKLLASRVQQRENGDVVVSEIPMVHQGPKGYCVPATWERYLRYLGIPADMYALAMAGQTAFGGGTSIDAMVDSVTDVITRYGRKIEEVDADLSIESVSEYIDAGLPIMWGMYVYESVNRDLFERANKRSGVFDWDAWKADLEAKRQKKIDTHSELGGPHLCMITGYNADTRELAISDSWGAEFAERWITVEEAKQISMNDFHVIKW